MKYLRGVTLTLYDRVVLLDPKADTSRCLFERPEPSDKPTLVVVVQDVEDAILSEYVRIELDPLNRELGWKA